MKVTSVYYKRIRKIASLICEGNLLAIDPSCGSTSSLPGWAHYRGGVLIASGVIGVDITMDLYPRLQVVADGVRSLSYNTNASVLIYEDPPAVRFHKSGRTSSGSQASLIKSVGAIMGASMADHAIGLRPSVWKKMVRATYVKSDERDAIEMGYIVIKVAKEILDASSSKKAKAR